ncbi:MAG: PKD domain-containing protein [Ginsengibacter sp.]
MKIFKLAQYLILSITSIFFGEKNAFSQIEFVENKGQWNKEVKFMSIAGSGEFYLQQNGFTVAQNNPADIENVKERFHRQVSGLTTSQGAKIKIHSHAYNVQFLNSKSAQIIPDKPIPSYNNYFIGNDTGKWAANCRIFKGVTYKDVYPGIDVRYYSDAGSNLKYDFIIHPGADVNNIAMKYTGANKLAVKNKQLLITTSLGDNRELSPYTYQVVDNKREELECRYVVDGDVVRFKVKNYTPGKTMIIDPTEKFFSYSGSTADNWGFTATYGPDGSFYGGGIAFGAGFPAATGSYDETFNGDFDIAIIKLTPNGKGRVYATYIGGNSSEQPHSLIVDPQGNLVIAGRSKSSDYPTYPSSVPKVTGSGGGWDIIVTKLNATGSALIGSMRIGGTGDDGVNIKDETGATGTNSLKRNYGDDARSEVLLDASNNIYLASCTSSTSSSASSDNFPTTRNAFQTKPGKNQDGVVLKINPDCNSILFSTFLGGSENDAAYVLVLANNNIYVAGGTASPDLPGISASGVISSKFAGGACDGFVVELNNSGTAVLSGTYLGTSSADQVYGIDDDKYGKIYVMGTTEGTWPVLNAGYSVPGSKQFIAKLEPDLSKYDYSTVFGSGNTSSPNLPNISPTAFLVDRCENVYVSGWGGKANQITGFIQGNTKGLPVTPDAIKPQTDASGSDFYFFVLKKDAASQLYGSFFGQEDPPEGVKNPETFGDHVDGGTSRFDKNGVIYEAMCANCFRTVAFPGTLGSWSSSNKATSGGECNLGMLKIEMNFAGVQAGVRASINGVPNDTTGCAPLRVDFTDTLNKGKSYYWNFGDGTGDTTTSPDISHIYNTTGTFKVRLIAVDSTTCNIFDTAYTHIRVGDNKALLNFVPNKILPCTNLSYGFTNTSIPTRGSFNPNTFTWDFGDNSALVISSQSPPITHTYAGPGTYIVKLSIDDTTFCNSPDDTIKTVRLSPEVKALFQTPARGCVPYTAVFTNNSLGGLSFTWDFGDGGHSTDDNPSHIYALAGSYTIRLLAFDSSSCNKVDSATFTITVSPIPVAAFTYNPNPPQENVFTNFVNQSLGATKYFWNFGDGDSSLEVNPAHIFPATATYNVCLHAANDAGCSDDTCVIVRALIKPLVDVPSAFTPGKFGVNGRIKVEGFGIKEMQWRIYNRWGQKVYETNNIKSSWDGTVNGKLQPLDVYAYTLDVVFSDGTKYRKTGDITLLR